MARLLLEINRIEDAPKRVITEGIVKYAMGFYMLMRKSRIEDYKGEIEKIIAYFWAMDDKYYNELDGNPEDMEELATFLDAKKI